MILLAVNEQTTQFVYDGDGNLVKKIKPDGSSTIYIGNVYEVDKSSGGAVTRTVTYYPAGGAMRIDGNVYYVLKDRLGSAYATTDASGNVVGEMRYYAFGETRLSTGTMLTDRLFTGQRYIAELGIYHFNARFYSPKLGRFLSADTLMSGFANPQNLNRFSYVANNPVRYTDPTGRCFIELSSHMVWFSDSDPKCGGSYTPTNDGGGGDGGGDDGGAGSDGGGSDNSTYLPYGPWEYWTTTSYPWSFPVYNSWGDQGPMEINPVDFEQMLKAVGDDLQGFPTLGWYDTPFYDAGGTLTGIGCIYGECYPRDELNYIGEGEALAKTGFSRETTQDIVWAWKNKGPFVLGLLGLDSTTIEVSQGTIDMTDIGWYYYNENYPPPSTSPEPEYILWP